MKKLVIGTVLTYDLDKIDIDKDEYGLHETVELLRRELQYHYEQFDLEVEVRDYIVEVDGLSVDWIHD